LNADYAFVADRSAGLRVISVADPASPVEVGFYDTPGSAYGVAVSADLAYVADYDSGLRVVAVADPADPVEVGYYQAPGRTWGVAVDGDYVYVTYEGSGLIILQFYGAGVDETQGAEVRTANPTSAVVRGDLRLGDWGRETGDQVELLDISGKKVLDLHPGANDVRALAPGVYFVRREPQASSHKPQAIRKIVLTK